MVRKVALAQDILLVFKVLPGQYHSSAVPYSFIRLSPTLFIFYQLRALIKNTPIYVILTLRKGTYIP